MLLVLAAAGCGADESESGGDGGLDAGEPSPDASADASLAVPPLVIPTTHGQVEGFVSEGVRAFLGIPFALPPEGDRRWKAPEPAAPWQGVRPAKAYGPSCAQNAPSGLTFDEASREDCLYLNVWAPITASATPRPVMVWIYGGAYVFGSGGPPYNGEKLVLQGDVIVVTMNYRLGPLGYMAHPGISAEADRLGGAKANFGVLDQRLALEWVRDNIAAFGGDPSNVTLFGESAGANSVTVHLRAAGSWGLFQRAIVESGSVMVPSLDLSEAEAQGSRHAAASGCTQSDPAQALACLRALPAARITQRSGPLPAAGGIFFQESASNAIYLPVIDGQILKEQAESAFREGRVARVPVLHGVTADEGLLFHIGIFGDRPPASLADYQAALANRLRPTDVPKVVERYPSFDTGLIHITADAVYRCPATRMAKYLSDHDIPQFVYRFALPIDAPLPPLRGKAFHSAELPYVFGNSYLLGSIPVTEAAFSPVIMGYWTRFARTGDPNGEGAPTWLPYSSTDPVHLNLADPIVQGDDLAAGCALWDTIPISAP